jgi:hypothetical protein
LKKAWYESNIYLRRILGMLPPGQHGSPNTAYVPRPILVQRNCRSRHIVAFIAYFFIVGGMRSRNWNYCPSSKTKHKWDTYLTDSVQNNFIRYTKYFSYLEPASLSEY